MRKIRSQEVAQAAGVSRSTLSKVLNNRETERIPEGTRQRVLEVVREMNYVPKSQMREIRMGRTNRIGLLLTHPAVFAKLDPYHDALFSGILRGAFRQHKNVILFAAVEESWESFRRDLLGGSSDGVIVVGESWGAQVEQALHRSAHPTVYVSVRPTTLETYCFVDCENRAGGRLAIEHLVQLGHRRIGMPIAPQSKGSYVRERVEGAQEAVHAKNIELVTIPTLEAEGIHRTIREGGGLTALFFPNAGRPLDCHFQFFARERTRRSASDLHFTAAYRYWNSSGRDIGRVDWGANRNSLRASLSDRDRYSAFDRTAQRRLRQDECFTPDECG
jgi:DNA-binding LacI/PurR family transcriptional regulator